MQGIALALLAVFHGCGTVPEGEGAQTDRRRETRIEEALRREGDVLVEMADAALARRGAADFSLTWRNDFFKAQPGTFVPFTVTFDTVALTSHAALLYIRVDRSAAAKPADDRPRLTHVYETIYPVRIEPRGAQPAHLTRGFAIPPGRYRVVVVIRETPEAGGESLPHRRASTLVRELDVPDFWTGDLAISTVILADRVEPLEEPVPADEIDEHPYVVGTNRIHPAAGSAFPRDRELVVVFLLYNPSVGADKHFDVQVDYHVYRKDRGKSSTAAPPDSGGAGPGERFVTRTNPQRFNPSMMGPRFDPAAGTPILAGPGISLSAVEPGEYRLQITVTDLLSRRSLSRDVAFAVIGL